MTLVKSDLEKFWDPGWRGTPVAEKFESRKVWGERSPRSVGAIFLQLTNIYLL